MIVPLRRRHALACLALLTLTGCGSSSAVSGKVTYKDKPLVGGTVTFYTADNKTRSSVIGEDGSYSITKLPPGKVRIAVSPPVTASAMPRGMKMDPGKMGAPTGPAAPTTTKAPPFPEQYKDPDKSGLTYDVTKGQQQHDIPLK